MTARGDGRVDPAGLRELRHELRTPINHIMGYSELLLEEAEETGLGGLAPERRGEIARFGLRAMSAGNLAAMLSASLAGMLA